MPLVKSHVRLIYQMLPTIGAEQAAELWKERLLAMAERLNQRRKDRIPDGESFIQRLAGPSAKAWRQLINPAFTSRAGVDSDDITSGQAANLQESFLKYQRQLDFLFETVDGITAKRFKELVERGQQDYLEGVARRTLPFTGSKMQGRGISPLATLWLTADPITIGELRAGDDVIEGGPFLICPASKKPGLKAMLNQRLIQAGAIIVKSDYAAAVIAKQNQLTAEQVQGFVDPALDLTPFVAGGDSHVDYIVVAGVFYLEIKVSVM